ncbi:MAG: M12 family metallopeptidase [Meiothermus sp.]|nr:M12 family metallopeptidase [Meiothermus sp.]
MTIKQRFSLAAVALALVACGGLNPGVPQTPGSAAQAPSLSIDGKTYRYEVRDGRAIFEGDIVIGNVEDLERVRAQGLFHDKERKCLVFYCWNADRDYRWPGGVVPFVLDGSVTSAGAGGLTQQAMNLWQAATPVRFVQRTSQSDFVAFVVDPGIEGCGESAVGRQGGRQEIRFKATCDFGRVAHEIGHALGLWHEQSREDRDRYIKVNLSNVREGLEHNFEKHVGDGLDIGAYDFDSIMHYGPNAFCKDPCPGPTLQTIPAGIAIGQRSRLSAGDIAAIRWLYMRNWVISDGGANAWRSFGDSSVKAGQMAVGDFNADGRTDLFRADPSACVWYVSYSQLSGPVIALGAGLLALAQAVAFPLPVLGTSFAGPWTVLSRGKCESLGVLRFGDFDGDRKTDVFVSSGGTWHISRGGVGWWEAVNASSVPLSQLAFGDFNGDGRTDVFRGDGSAWHVSYGGTTPWTFLNSSSHEAGGLGFGDFDGDGRTDVFKANGSTWEVSYGGSSVWTFLNSSSHTLGGLRFGDFDGDRKTDVYRPDGGGYKVSSDGTGAWQDLPAHLKLPPYTSVGFLFGDFDGNGGRDVLAAVN